MILKLNTQTSEKLKVEQTEILQKCVYYPVKGYFYFWQV